MQRQGLFYRLITALFIVLISVPLISGSINTGSIAFASSERSSPTLTKETTEAAVNQSVDNILRIAISESVTILLDGNCTMALSINVPPSPLADAYRKSLGVTSEVSANQELPIPENVTISTNGETGKNAAVVLPIREGFYGSIERQQETSLGLIAKIVKSSVVPRTDNNECRVFVEATGILPISQNSQNGTSHEWEVTVRPPVISAIVGSVLSSAEMIKMLLKSIPEEQTYECLWTTKINLPADAQVLNGQEISALRWEVSLGGGTYLHAWIEVEGTSAIILNEETVIGEKATIVSPSYICSAFSSYKNFRIQYELAEPASSSIAEYANQTTLQAGSGDNFSYEWEITWSDTETATFSYGPLNAELSATATLTLSGYVGWYFDIFQGLTQFESWMSLGASVEVNFEAIASASYSKTWEQTFFSWSTQYTFFVGVAPVWANLEITATGVLSVNAYGQISLTASATASSTFKAGVRWTNNYGWSPIFDVTTNAQHTGPTFNAKAGVGIRPSLQFRIAFLFYGVAGPFVEFEPYALATVTCTYPPPHGEWEITANFGITAGATFAGWLKDLLGLDDWSTLLYNAELMRWSGSWGSSSISVTETLNPSTSPPEGSVLVSGTATFNDGSPVSYMDVIVTVSGMSWTTTTDGAGEYSRFISAPGSVGSYAVQVRVYTGSLSGSTSQTLTVNTEDQNVGTFALSGVTTCKDVQPDSPYDPIGETDVFRRTDSRSIVWVYLTGQIRNTHTVRWEWYTPSGSYYTQTTHTTTDPASQGYDYWAWYKCWGWINIVGNQAQDLEGRWHCKVYIDGQFKRLVEFVIGYEVTDRTIAQDVQTSDPYEPIGRTDGYLNTDPKAWAWIRMDNVAESLEIKWEWYDPFGALYGDPFFWTTANPSSYWPWYKAWCWISICGYPPQSKLGLWQVKAYIKDVYGTWDPEYSQYFVISDNTPPGTPGTPSDGGDYSSTGTVNWVWTAAPEDGSVTRYQLQIGTAPGGNNIFDGYVSGLNMTLYALPSGLTYYARARAMNSVGQWGPWSANSDGIAVDMCPTTVFIEAPSETIEYDDVTCSWKGSDDITPVSSLAYSYYLVGKDAGWSTWQSGTSVQYTSLQDGNYLFLVKARDQRGNEDPTPANASFTVAAVFTLSTTSKDDVDVTSDIGTLEFDGANYSLPTSIRSPLASHIIKYNSAERCLFDHWETTGGVSVLVPTDNPTEMTISDNGTLKAVFTRPLKLNAGWNMISFPAIPANTNFTDIFKDVGYYQVVSWSGTSYVDMKNESVEAGRGY